MLHSPPGRMQHAAFFHPRENTLPWKQPAHIHPKPEGLMENLPSMSLAPMPALLATFFPKSPATAEENMLAMRVSVPVTLAFARVQ